MPWKNSINSSKSEPSSLIPNSHQKNNFGKFKIPKIEKTNKINRFNVEMARRQEAEKLAMQYQINLENGKGK